MLIFFANPIIIYFMWAPGKIRFWPQIITPEDFLDATLRRGGIPISTLQISATGQLLADSTFFPYGESAVAEWGRGALLLHLKSVVTSLEELLRGPLHTSARTHARVHRLRDVCVCMCVCDRERERERNKTTEITRLWMYRGTSFFIPTNESFKVSKCFYTTTTTISDLQKLTNSWKFFVFDTHYYNRFIIFLLFYYLEILQFLRLFNGAWVRTHHHL